MTWTSSSRSASLALGLNVAWQYLSQPQKESYKQQARQILHQLREVKPSLPAALHGRTYVAPDPDPVSHKGIKELEYSIIFSEGSDEDFSLMHNDLTQSNCIVNDDKIVGVVDWEMAGFFGWNTAAQVHVQIRTPKKENYAQLNLPEDFMQDILFWNDLYEV